MGTHKEQIQKRLKTIEGHVRGVQRMVEEDVYCIDILKQTRAIRQALSKIDTLILDDHLNHCVTTAIRSDELAERERVVNELLQVFAASERA